jgi:AraC family transcriptional regulator, transcriptional activator of pobA
MHYQGANKEHLWLGEMGNKTAFDELNTMQKNVLTFIWVINEQEITIDDVPLSVKKNQVVCVTEFHRLHSAQLKDVRVIQFNRAFYCIKDHDAEVGCKGHLFYNAASLAVITIPKDEREKFDLLWKMFLLEMNTIDSLQFEMLQMMLKRFIIMVTRLYKTSSGFIELKPPQVQLIRDFNFLVEAHFKKLHTVSAYAELLNKSPKTLTNTFAQQQMKPSQIIHDRIMLEARRLLRYSDKPVKEIAYELGYEDVQVFSRAFKQKEGIYPTEFRSVKLN